MTHNEGAFLVLDFSAAPVDYVAFPGYRFHQYFNGVSPRYLTFSEWTEQVQAVHRMVTAVPFPASG